MLAFNTHAMPARFQARGHGHARVHLVAVLDGSFEEETTSSILDMAPGAVRLSRAHEHHGIAFGSDGARCLIIEGEGAFWGRIFARALKRRANTFGAADCAHVTKLAAIQTPEHLAHSRDALLAFGRVLASIETGADDSAPSWLDDAIDALDHGRAITAVARAVRRDRAHFARAFAAHVGFRPSEYRAIRRVGAAAAAIRDTGEALADLALANGFAHQSHMNNDFRALLGRSPARLRAA